jgi:hypothetical protein
MGSLASRIFNPPTAEKMEAAEATAEAAVSVPSAAAPIVVEAEPSTSAAPKVAPDA